MAHVTLDDGRELDVDDSDTGLLDYYRGINAKVEADTVLVPPYTIENGEVVAPPVVTEVAAVEPEPPTAEDAPAPAPVDETGLTPDESVTGKRR